METTRKLYTLARVAALSALALTALHARADQLSDIKHKGELVCGVLGTDEPFSYMKDPMSRASTVARKTQWLFNTTIFI